MKRFIVDIGTFAIAFALGFAAVKFFPGSYVGDEMPPVVSTISESPILGSATANGVPVPIAERLTCNEASLRPFWNILAKHGEFVDLDSLYKWLSPGDNNQTYDCSDFFRVNQLRDLNGDGREEVFVDGINAPFCDMSVDCTNFVFELVDGSYRLILYQPYSITYKVMSKSTNHYSDIEFRDNGRLGVGDVWLYKFDGKTYRLSQSKRYLSEEFRNGDMKTYDPPKVSHLKCNDHPPEKMSELYCDRH